MNHTQKPKKEATQNPGKEDVHEQREPEQEREGVVHETEKDAGRRLPSPQSGR